MACKPKKGSAPKQPDMPMMPNAPAKKPKK